MIEEIWKDIIGYENLYRVSNLGQVYSIGGVSIPNRGGSFRLSKSRVLSLNPFDDGYCRVSLKRDRKQKMFLVHRLVALHFLENPENKQQVNHLDGNKSNNIYTNLEWATKLENQRHAIATGLQDFVGENSPQCILSEREVLEIRSKHIKREYSQSMLAKEYGTTRSNIDNILSRRTWKHI